MDDKCFEMYYRGKWAEINNDDVEYYISLETRIRNLEDIVSTNNEIMFLGGDYTNQDKLILTIRDLKREQRRIADYKAVRESALRRMKKDESRKS